MGSFSTLTVSVADGVGSLVLNRPAKGNSISREMCAWSGTVCASAHAYPYAAVALAVLLHGQALCPPACRWSELAPALQWLVDAGSRVVSGGSLLSPLAPINHCCLPSCQTADRGLPTLLCCRLC